MNKKKVDLPKIRDLLISNNIKAKKKYSQNFILDFNVLDKIVDILSPIEKYSIIEIGPGPGGLSRSILARSPKELVVIEKDNRFYKLLQDIKLNYNNISIIEADVLKVNLSEVSRGQTKIIGNLPYNISTKILTTLMPIPKNTCALVLTFQKEVAERIVSLPNKKTYGRLSILAQSYCDVSIEMKIPASVFYPKPKVDSSVVKFIPKKDNSKMIDSNLLKKITRATFGQRRKMIKKTLSIFGDSIKICDLANVSYAKRADELSIEDYHSLYFVIKRIDTSNL